MHFISFLKAGKPGFGIVSDRGVVDAQQRSDFATLLDALRAGALDRLSNLAARAPDFDIGSVQLLPPVPQPSKIFCVGLNYKSHVAETGRDLPENPSLFLRTADTLAGPGFPLIKPIVSDHFDFEGELAVIIGRRGRHIPPARALEYVAGYSCFNDGSLRDFQKHSVTAGKNFPSTGGFGPALVTADEIENPQGLDLVTRLNGTEVQRSNTSLMIYPIAQVIAYVSQFTELLPGDVIATGTPEGVGARRTPPLWMKAGDVIEVDIERIGTLKNPIVPETAK